MGVYVEITCDVARPSLYYGFGGACHSSTGDGPQGRTVTAARKEARAQGWRRIEGRDVCPFCATEGEKSIS